MPSRSEVEEETEETAGEDEEASDEGGGEASSEGGSDGIVTEAEKEVITEWLTFATGLVAALGIAIGLNANIQDQWGHALISSNQFGLGFSTFLGPGGLMTLGVVVFTLLGYTYAQHVDNTDQTAYKVGIVTSLVGVPVLSLLGGFLVAQPSNGSLETVNVLVSGLGSGIAAAVGSAIVIWLTEEQAPDALTP